MGGLFVATSTLMISLIEATDITKIFRVRSDGFFRARRALTALSRVSLSLQEGESLGLVGESGSGKTTLGKIIAGLLEPDQGMLKLAGRDSVSISRTERARFAQMVFQDPTTSLNPKLSIGTQIGEAVRFRSANGAQDAGRWLERVGLSHEMLSAYPHQLSGGQKQRASIARAIAAGPRIVIADEPVSSLDLSIQAQILRLLIDLKLSLGISYLVISHDLSVVAVLCEKIIVLKDGVIQEEGKTANILKNPRHPYTQRLLKSVPKI